MATKWKDRVNKILDAEEQRLKEKYRDAEGSYRDTGYDRYYNMMERCEKALNEVQEYRNSRIMIAEAESNARRYRKVVTKYLASVSEYAEDHKGVDRPVEETVGACKYRLERALQEEGLL